MQRVRASYKATVIINLDFPLDSDRMIPVAEMRERVEKGLTPEIRRALDDAILDPDFGTLDVVQEACSFELSEE